MQSEVGCGAMFVIELPVAEKVSGLPGGTAKPWTGKNFVVDAEGKSVLVIDDELWILELSRELLGGDGYEVETVPTGEEAFQRIGQRRFDVILSDWKMPGLNGMHLYEQLLTTDPVSAGRMIFMTGDVMNEAFQEFLKRNGRSYLAKPFAIGDLRQAVASGTVTFSDGVTGKWIIDQYGRPGFTEVSQPGYRPSPQDGQAFMKELSRALQQRGY